MSDDSASSFGRFVVVALLAMGTLGFGLAGLCGGVYTAMALPELFLPQSYSSLVLFFSLPSLLIGAGLAWLCARKLWRLARSQHAQ